jgi:DNA-binding MarR family transcriptional regulator
LKYVAWLLAGVGLGFIVAHQVSRTPAGKALFETLDESTRELTGAIREGFSERSAQLRNSSL